MKPPSVGPTSEETANALANTPCMRARVAGV